MCGFREPFGECVVMHQLVAMRFKLALYMSNVIEPRGEKAFGLDQDEVAEARRAEAGADELEGVRPH